jgi:uncharacterized protein YyaL (SSP411 family)
MSGNELRAAASPYLLQHADNPVHWRLWGDASLAEAQALNKPILLSIGYAACHWCHVMAHESFEDDETAAVMNALFVNIKVDREERPDIDHIYMSALHAFGERGGWPLTMFLTSKGEPFWGGTYFPKTARYGRPSFVQVLRSVARAYEQEPAQIAGNARAVREALGRTAPEAPAGALSLASVDGLVPKIRDLVDPVHGGLNGAPKFPNPQIFEFLWRAWRRTGDPICRDRVHLTLTQMSEGGIYDHLGGGFARYSTDERWLVPHFEKMLYDNAQLLELLALVWRETGDPLLRQRAVETVGWLAREMTTPEGAFCASLDADSEGEEGKFYVWTWPEILGVLGEDDAAFFGAFYDAAAAGNWTEEHHGRRVIILNRLKLKAPPDAASEHRLASLRARLFAARAPRVRPGLDDKVMADWNGLMIAALVNAATLFEEPDWIVRAARAYGFVADTLRCTDAAGQDRLAHSWRGGVLVAPGLALDHAAMVRAALALHEARNRPEMADLPHRDYLADATAWTRALLRFHRDQNSGLLTMSAADATDVILRLAPTQDDAIPNTHAVLLPALVRLAALSGDATWLATADALLAALAGPVAQSPLAHCGILNALDFRLRVKEIVTVGADRAPLYAAALAVPFAERVVVDLDAAASLPSDHPAHAQLAHAMKTGAAAFVCAEGSCSLPVHDPAELDNHAIL